MRPTVNTACKPCNNSSCKKYPSSRQALPPPGPHNRWAARHPFFPLSQSPLSLSLLYSLTSFEPYPGQAHFSFFSFGVLPGRARTDSSETRQIRNYHQVSIRQSTTMCMVWRSGSALRSSGCATWYTVGQTVGATLPAWGYTRPASVAMRGQCGLHYLETIVLAKLLVLI